MTTHYKENGFEGYLDRIGNGWVSGWAWQPELPNEPISVDVHVDDDHETTILATAYRPDLKKAGKGNGRHAFEVRLPEQCLDGKPHSIRLYYHGTTAVLDGSPQTVSLEPEAASAYLFNRAEQRIPLSLDERMRGEGNEDLGDRPTVSVIIPCYNLGEYLDEAVQSVLNQSFQDFEVIIIDDGSTDPATRHLFASYQRPKARILRTENQGLAKTRNLGIKEARGRYISCLDADDLLEPDFLRRTVEVLESDPSLTFVSCWLKGFGETHFDWNPVTCEFPHLLAEDTVCTPALMRREALLQVGGFDAHMPVPGYEDWDLAISLVERGLRGTIIPEYLFKYRIRRGSMSVSCTEPGNHGLLMRYIAQKHAESYRAFLSGVLETIEKRIIELMPPVAMPQDINHERRIEFLERNIRSILNSRSWKLTRPLRQLLSRLKSVRRMIGKSKASPRISVVLTCRDQGRELPTRLASIYQQLGPEDEVIIVDYGSADLLTLEILDWYRESGVRIIRTPRVGFLKARAAGLEEARGTFLLAVGADQTLDPSYIEKSMSILISDPNVAFVTCGLHDEATGFIWLPESIELKGLVGCSRMPFPLVRRAQFSAAGAYDMTFSEPELADWELTLRLSERGQKGALIKEPLVTNCWEQIRNQGWRGERRPAEIKAVVERHRPTFESYWQDAVLGLENQRRLFQAHRQREVSGQEAVAPRSIDWGELRRLQPISRAWGLDRGQPIDRYYIEGFLDRNRDAIRGRVLEVKDAGYTKAYGSAVETSDVIDIAPENPSATLVCDLAAKGSLPENTYECFILTQTIHIIYEIRNVVENAYRTLRPGGVLLATLPCVSRLDYESGLEGDCWRFTPASAKKMFEDVFGLGQVEVHFFGNVLVCSSFLLGLSAQDLKPEELDYNDPYFPLIVCVRAVKAVSGGLFKHREHEGVGQLVENNKENLLDRLLHKDHETAHLLRGNYELERYLDTWLVPEIVRRKTELDGLREKFSRAKIQTKDEAKNDLG